MIISGDRRDIPRLSSGSNGASREYPITVDLVYRLLSHGVVVKSGCGRTISLSSARVLFIADDRPPLDSQVELSIVWPVRLNNEVDLQLSVFGQTAPTPSDRDHCIAVDILRHDFRTRRQHSPGISYRRGEGMLNSTY